MNLTGQCATDFTEWYYQNPEYSKYPFTFIHPAMQWGVLVDFFDQSGVNISLEYYSSIQSDPENTGGFEVNIFNKRLHEWQDRKLLSKRSEARTASIEKAVEIYNQSTT